MILINGCSFTYGSELRDHKKTRYSTILSELLNEEIENIAEASKSNFYMAFELSAYLLHKYNNNEELPRIVIWQHTDCMRDHLPDWHFTGTWRPNDLDSLLGIKKYLFRDRFIKITSWARYNDILSKRSKLSERSKREYSRRVGMGSDIRPYNGLDGPNFLCNDETFQFNEFRHAINVINLQNLCDQLGVRLIHYNYYAVNNSLLSDPIFQQIDRSDYVFSNSENSGAYNHLLHKGFDRPDNFHFDESAHLYQARLLYEYITNGTKVEAEEESALTDNFPVFDYAGEDKHTPGKKRRRFDGRDGRVRFLQLALNKK